MKLQYIQCIYIHVRLKIIKKIGEFIDGTEKRQEFPSMDKVSRAIM